MLASDALAGAAVSRAALGDLAATVLFIGVSLPSIVAPDSICSSPYVIEPVTCPVSVTVRRPVTVISPSKRPEIVASAISTVPKKIPPGDTSKISAPLREASTVPSTTK